MLAKNRKVFLPLFLVLIIGLAGFTVLGELSVPETPDADEGGTLTIGISQTLKSLDPRMGQSNYDSYVHGNIFDPLFTKNPDTLEPEPMIAKSWEVSEDGTEVTFYLHEGIEFHNGEELTAEDVKFTFEWISNPDNGSPWQPEFDWLKEVVIDNQYQCTFMVKEEDAPNPAMFAGGGWSVLPKDTVQEMGAEEFAKNPVGSGPFEFEEWRTGDRVILDRNEDYWLGKPNLEKVVFRPIPETSVMMAELEAGGVDITDSMPADAVSRFKEMDEVVVQQKPSVLYFYLAFNHAHAPGDSYKFRKAVYQAVDWTGAVNSIFEGITGQRIYGALAPTIWANDQEWLEENLAVEEDKEAAKKKFEELKEEGVFPEDRPLKIITPLDPKRRQLGTILATALKQNGIEAEVQPLDWGPLLEKIYRSESDPKGSDFDMYIIGQGVGPDPYYYLHLLFHSEQRVVGSPNNKSWYSNEKVDMLLDRAATTFDQTERKWLYTAAQMMIFKDIAHIPLYTYISTQGVREQVKDYQLIPTGGRIDICGPYSNVWLEG